jgi:sirohydrochlorin ferrochelatase
MKKALLIVDHGSTIQESNTTLLQIAELVQNMRPELIVHTAHLEVLEPSIEQGILSCIADGADEIVVHPYMLAPGRHATKDIPRLVESVALNHPQVKLSVCRPLGLHQKLAEIVLERAGLQP